VVSGGIITLGPLEALCAIRERNDPSGGTWEMAEDALGYVQTDEAMVGH
jgi:hypothetical protein